MSEPTIADRRPMVMELEPGTYFWCQCGLSQNQPWCDGAHKGTGFAPLPLKIEETRKVAMCLCKHSENKPFCDGAHSRLP